MTSVDRAVGVSELESSESVTRMGIDIGGTFTDVAAVDGRGQLFIGKRLTSHGGEHEAVVAAIADSHVSLDEPQTIVAHATTLVINSLIERRGARVGLVTTRGFADVLDIRRGTRPEIFNLFYQRDDTLVPKALRMELYERVSASGDVELQPSDEKLAELADFLRRKKVEAIAIAFINAYVEPANERYVARYLREALPEVPVTLSSDLSREWREYERTSTVVANAYVIPVAKRYLRRLLRGLGDRGFTGDFVVLDSNGGALHVDTATALPIRTVESGPVAGVIGARALAARLSIPNVVTFDMGGTTAKTCLIEDGRYASTNLYFIGGYSRGFPLQVPTADVIEVGAGGGSIAWVDHGGRLRVGPRSAGSQPGPACYGLGGTEPTVTDANLYCGRIDANHFAGALQINADLAASAIRRIAELLTLSERRLALGMLELANLSMADAVRRQTLERGRDPREFTLVAFGGAGPMHSCEVAAKVGIPRVLIPPFPGHFSAIGMLGANLRLDRREMLRANLESLDVGELHARIWRIASSLESEIALDRDQLDGEVTFGYSLALRYVGQDHTLLIPGPDDTVAAEGIVNFFAAAFADQYLRRYGHLDDAATLEVVELEVVAERRLPGIGVVTTEGTDGAESQITSYFDRDDRPVTSNVIPRGSLRPGDRFTGPLVIYEEGATSVIPPSASGEVIEGNSLLIAVG